MMCVLRAACLFGLTLGLPALAQADEKNKASADKENMPFSDETFVKKAACDGMAEVKMSQWVVDNGSNADVKKFAQQMIADHTKANEELKAAAKSAGVTCPAEVSDKHKKEMKAFMELKGRDLDKKFVEHAVKDHKKDVAFFTMAGEKLQNNELKNFAARTLPVLKGHLQMAETLSGDRSGAQ